MFDFLVPVHFQVSSGEGEGGKGEQEVIEFPWAALDVAARQVTDDHRILVKPTAHPTLSQACIQKTGVTQADVDAANPLQNAVQEFNAYLYKEFTANNKDFCLVTFGEEHLKRWLRADARRKGVKLVAHYSKFLDVGAEYKRQKPAAPSPATLPELCASMGVEIEVSKGGLGYSRAIANVLAKLLEEGAKCTSAVNISEDYDPTAEEPAPLQVMVSGRAESADPESNTVIKLRGLPFSAAEGEVMDFFSGLRRSEEQHPLLPEPRWQEQRRGVCQV